MPIRIAINGFGRIGRAAAKVILQSHEGVELVAINDRSDHHTLAHLFKYDSFFGVYPGEVTTNDTCLFLEGKKIHMTKDDNPANLPWKELKIDVVLECTGAFRTIDSAKAHLDAGASFVVISAPAKDDVTPTFVMGVNHKDYKKGQTIVSNASCTTNCMAPITKIIDDEYGVAQAMMTTIHSYTSSQRLVDSPHKDLRRGRAAVTSLIPTTTGAAIAVSKVLPHLEGKLNGMAVRVPTQNVSLLDVTFETTKAPKDREEVIALLKDRSKKDMRGVVDVCEDKVVSVDLKASLYSSIVDAEFVKVQDNMVKILAWYDNEWGYATKLVELARFIGHH